MCIVLFTTAHPAYSLILIDNRDEYILRPTSRPQWWTHPLSGGEVLSSRDLHRAAKGTWLGVTKTGILAVLTNYREAPNDADHPIHGIKSRGRMVNLWLGGLPDGGVKQGVDSLVKDGGVKGVGGFSMVCTKLRREGEGIAIVSNRAADVSDVPMVGLERDGVWGLSNTVYSDPVEWPKVAMGKRLLREVVSEAVSKQSGEEALIAGLFSVLDTTTMPERPAGSTLQEYMNLLKHTIFVTAIGDEEPAAESTPDPAAGFEEGIYGTQRQTVLLVDWEGNATFVERALWDAEGNEIGRGEGDAVFRFKIEGWEGGDDEQAGRQAGRQAGWQAVEEAGTCAATCRQPPSPVRRQLFSSLPPSATCQNFQLSSPKDASPKPCFCLLSVAVVVNNNTLSLPSTPSSTSPSPPTSTELSQAECQAESQAQLQSQSQSQSQSTSPPPPPCLSEIFDAASKVAAHSSKTFLSCSRILFRINCIAFLHLCHFATTLVSLYGSLVWIVVSGISDYTVCLLEISWLLVGILLIRLAKEALGAVRPLVVKYPTCAVLIHDLVSDACDLWLSLIHTEQTTSYGQPAICGDEERGPDFIRSNTLIIVDAIKDCESNTLGSTPDKIQTSRRVSAGFQTDGPLASYPTVASSGITARPTIETPSIPKQPKKPRKKGLLAASSVPRPPFRTVPTTTTLLPRPATITILHQDENAPPVSLDDLVCPAPPPPRLVSKLPKSRTMNALHDFKTSISRPSLAVRSINSASFSGSSRKTSSSSSSTITSQPSSSASVPSSSTSVPSSNTSAPSSSISKFRLSRPSMASLTRSTRSCTPELQPMQITTAQCSAYWSGRFMALHDRFSSEKLVPDASHSSAQLIRQLQTSAVGSPYSNLYQRTSHLPLSNTTSALRTITGATTAPPANDDDTRCRRVFAHLDSLCTTSEAKRSLHAWQQAYARRHGRPSLLPDGGSMEENGLMAKIFGAGTGRRGERRSLGALQQASNYRGAKPSFSESTTGTSKANRFTMS